MTASMETVARCGPVVVGSGIAGVLTALSMAPTPVLLIGNGPSCSDWAQGGVAAAVGAQDSPAQHFKDTLAASSGLNEDGIVQLVTSEGPKRIRLLEAFGAQFDHTGDGYALGREAAHSCHRILHCAGDATGAGLMRALWQRVAEADHITVLSPVTVDSLIAREGRIAGLRLRRGMGKLTLKTDRVVLATGGVGQLFEQTTNPAGVWGSGLGMALRAGAQAVDSEFVQFHPTAIDLPGLGSNPLATEALRGAGAVLRDADGVRFMLAAHAQGELAPRDIVARAVFRAIRETGRVWLDATAAVGADFPDRFPTVFGLCRKHGIDPREEPVPVTPAAHYHMGGIRVDRYGRTSVDGLWAVGEVACTGLHGANRLASNSLLEGMVFAPLVAENVKHFGRRLPPVAIPSVTLKAFMDGPETREESPVPGWLRETMYRNVGLVRDADGLTVAFREVSAWQTDSETEANMRAAARAIVACALLREESRGGHYRSDFPQADPAQATRRTIELDQVDAVGQLLPQAAAALEEGTLSHV